MDDQEPPLRTIDKDVQTQNLGVNTAWRKVRDRDTWQQVISTAMLCEESATTKKKTKLSDAITWQESPGQQGRCIEELAT